MRVTTKTQFSSKGGRRTFRKNGKIYKGGENDNVLNSSHKNLILTRYLSASNLINNHLPENTMIDIGLRIQIENVEMPIMFAKYIFKSNDNQQPVYQYLQHNNYTNSQYIGFFDNDYLNKDNFGNYMKFINDSEIIFTFALSDLNNSIHVQFIPNDNPSVDDNKNDNRVVTYKKGVFQYLQPGAYYEKLDNDRERMHSAYQKGHSNPGEYDIVARTEVFGIAYNVLTLFEPNVKKQLNSGENKEKLDTIINGIYKRIIEEKPNLAFIKPDIKSMSGMDKIYIILQLLNKENTKTIALDEIMQLSIRTSVKKYKTFHNHPSFHNVKPTIITQLPQNKISNAKLSPSLFISSINTAFKKLPTPLGRPPTPLGRPPTPLGRSTTPSKNINIVPVDVLRRIAEEEAAKKQEEETKKQEAKEKKQEAKIKKQEAKIKKEKENAKKQQEEALKNKKKEPLKRKIEENAENTSKKNTSNKK